ncbi:MAG: hypothetical protein AAB910_03880, partial [Patescibacteria group bacterium]
GGAVPATAQNRRSGNRRGYQYGYSGTALEAVTARNMGMVNGLFGELGYGSPRYNQRSYDTSRDRYNRPGYNHRYNDYGYGGYRRGLSRNEAIGAAVVVGGGLLINAVANRHRDDASKAEEPSKCFERVVKNARKQHVELDASEAMAFCNGQPIQGPVTEIPPTMQDASSLVTNETGECLFVDGQRLERGQRMGVDDVEHIGISTERGSSCRVIAKFNRQNGISLFCS